jgi:pimeloyl-ACP methyl ester carboxylesterase
MTQEGVGSEQTVPSFDGAPISYTVAGQGTPALVFVHGWSCNQGHWEAQVARFSSNHQVVTIDLAGHGLSGRGSRQAWSMTNFGRDVQAVVEALDLREVVLLGHSMGGAVILEAARLMPERVALLIGVDSLTYEHIYPKIESERIEAFMVPFKANFAEATRQMVPPMFLPETDPALVERVATEMSSTPPEVGLPAMKGLLEWDLLGALGQNRTPLRCLNTGERLSETARQRFAGHFEIITMTGVGHFLMMENPEGFNRLLAGTLAG